MFFNKTETDDYGISQVRYYLTQGDSCGIISTPVDESGTAIDVTLIDKCKFKIMSKKYVIQFEKEMDLQVNSYLFNFTSTESAELPVATYRYEIEYTFKDGSVNTTNSYYFEIIPQGVEE